MKKITVMTMLVLLSASVFSQSRPARQMKSAVHSRNIYVVSPATVIFSDNMDGDNSIAGLTTRGYATYYRGTGPQGTSPEWFQGDPFAFLSYNGPDSGYVASDYNSVQGTNDLDNWLVTPAVAVAAGDSMSFYSSAFQGSTFADSIRVMFNPTGATLPEDVNWVQLDNFLVDTSGVWLRHAYEVPTTSASATFGIRHAVSDAGPGGNNSDYIGVDQIDIFSTPAVPVGTFDTCAYAINIDAAFGQTIGVVQTVGPYDNTTATTTGDDPATGWECFGEPDGSGTAPELNKTVWFTFTGDGNNYFVESGNCAGVTNYIDDGDTQFALYTGTCGALVPKKCNEDGPNATASTYPAGFSFGTTVGVTYYLLVDGFSFNGAISDGEFCLKVTQTASVTCSDPSVTIGTITSNYTNLCAGDTLRVNVAGAIAPTTGDFQGIGMIISSAPLTGLTDPLNDPSLLATYGFASPVPTNYTRTFVNDGTAAFITQGNTYYWTPVVFGNATQASAGSPVFLQDLTLDPTCTVTGTSQLVNVLAPNDPLCTVGIAENLPGKKTSISIYPSPAQDLLNLEFTSFDNASVTFEITDNAGRLVKSGVLNATKGINNTEVNVKSLASGSYFLTIKDHSTDRNVKFIKQ